MSGPVEGGDAEQSVGEGVAPLAEVEVGGDDGGALFVALGDEVVQESVRAFYTGWYRELVTRIPVIENGWILPPEGPGLGTELLPDLHERKDAHVVVSRG